jgi:hypothetical protein
MMAFKHTSIWSIAFVGRLPRILETDIWSIVERRSHRTADGQWSPDPCPSGVAGSMSYWVGSLTWLRFVEIAATRVVG